MLTWFVVTTTRAQGVTFPIDITKTRLQLQGQADFTGTKFGFGGMAMNIAKTEGMGGLYAGCTPAVARHIPYTGFRAIGYEYIRAFFCGDRPKDQAPLLAKMAAGMSAGGIGQAIAVPCDLIKVRMQGDGRLVAAGKLDKPRYTGLFDAFTKIKAAEGMGGFYAGCWPAIQRAALVNLGEWRNKAPKHKDGELARALWPLVLTACPLRSPCCPPRRAHHLRHRQEVDRRLHWRQPAVPPVLRHLLGIRRLPLLDPRRCGQVAHHGTGARPRRQDAIRWHARLLAQGRRQRGAARAL